MSFNKIIENDAPAIVTMSVAFFTNLFNALSEVEINTWFATITFLLATVIGVLKAKVYYFDWKMKKIQFQEKMREIEEVKILEENQNNTNIDVSRD